MGWQTARRSLSTRPAPETLTAYRDSRSLRRPRNTHPRAGRTVPRAARRLLGALVVPWLLLGTATAWPQEPDSLPVAPPQAQDSAQAADSAQALESVVADSLTVRTFPRFPFPVSEAPGEARAWDSSDLLSSGALSFADLVEFAPLLTPVRAGFFEGPQAAVFAGSGPGGFSYEVDGYEVAPLLGGAVDLHEVPLVELESARLVRGPGGFRAIGQTYRRDRAEPYSRIEGGTGDRDTNLLRGFISTQLFGMPFGFGYDRIDSQGAVGRAERTFVWSDVAVPLFGGLWAELEFRSLSVGRDSFPNISRTDWIARIRREFGTHWWADVVAGAASVDRELLEEDSLSTLPRHASARQVAIRAARVGEAWRAQLTLRAWDGDGVPKFAPEASVELRLGPATFYGKGSYEEWEKFQVAGGYVAAQVDLPLGVRVSAEIEEGDRGVVGGVPKPRYEYGRRVVGAQITLLDDYRVGVRFGRQRAEPSLALGPPVDTVVSLAGGTADLTELWVSGVVARPFGGTLQVGARYREHDLEPFFYWPDLDWSVDGSYRLLALNDQLEIRLTAIGGVRGSMIVVDPELGPGTGTDLSYLHGEAVVRVKDVHIWVNYEYFDAVEDPADLIGFNFPRARSHLGLKWEFWN